LKAQEGFQEVSSRLTRK